MESPYANLLSVLETQQALISDAFEIIQGNKGYSLMVPFRNNTLFEIVFTLENIFGKISPFFPSDEITILVFDNGEMVYQCEDYLELLPYNERFKISTNGTFLNRNLTIDIIPNTNFINRNNLYWILFFEGAFPIFLLIFTSIIFLLVVNIREEKITDRIKKSLEEERENFIGTTTHELRTPLTVLRGYSEHLHSHWDEIEPKERSKSFSKILDNISRIERLIASVSDITQLDHGTFKLDIEEVDLCTFLDEEFKIYQIKLGSQLELQFCNSNDQDRAPIHVRLDPRRMSQVLGNLILNAIKYTSEEDRKIIISLIKESEEVKIDFTDNGGGIKPEVIEKIFQPFVSIPSGNAAQGSGVGLFLAKKIVEAHSGSINAFSKGENQGSTFTVRLPIEHKKSR